MGFSELYTLLAYQYIPMITTFLNYFFFTKLNFGIFSLSGFCTSCKGK